MAAAFTVASRQKYPKLRANPDNRLYLVGKLGALFERGRISFDEKNRIMISDVIPTMNGGGSA